MYVLAGKGDLGTRADSSLCRLISKVEREKAGITQRPRKIICPPTICQYDVK